MPVGNSFLLTALRLYSSFSSSSTSSTHLYGRSAYTWYYNSPFNNRFTLSAGILFVAYILPYSLIDHDPFLFIVMKYSFVALAATSIFGGALAAGHGHHHHHRRQHYNPVPQKPQDSDCVSPEVPAPCTTLVTSYLVPVEHTYHSKPRKFSKKKKKKLI